MNLPAVADDIAVLALTTWAAVERKRAAFHRHRAEQAAAASAEATPAAVAKDAADARNAARSAWEASRTAEQQLRELAREVEDARNLRVEYMTVAGELRHCLEDKQRLHRRLEQLLHP